MLTKQYYGLGTLITLSVSMPADETDLDAGYHVIKNMEDKFTVNRDGSEVMAINHAAGTNLWVSVSPDTFELISKSVKVSQLHKGFNVAIGPLVKLWHIGFKDAHKPSQTVVKKIMPLLDSTAIELDPAHQSVRLSRAGMELDLGGIAKGFIADAVRKEWIHRGVNSGIIDLGGNILLLGKGPHNGLWCVGIQDPNKTRNNILGSLITTAKSVVTSGIYERYLTVNGKDYHHIFDDQTGYPLSNDLASVTIVSEKSLDGDIWATLTMAAGSKKGRIWLNKVDGIEGIFVTRDGSVSCTKGLKQDFKKSHQFSN